VKFPRIDSLYRYDTKTESKLAREFEKRYKEDLKDVGIELDDFVLNELLLPTEEIEFQNDVQFANVLIYGSQGQGKSELAKALGYLASKKYGKQVKVVMGRNIRQLLEKAGDKFVTLLVLEDAT